MPRTRRAIDRPFARAPMHVVLFALALALVGVGVRAQALPSVGIGAEVSPERIETLTEEAFYWGINVVGFYELRYVYTQFEGHPAYRGINRLQATGELMDASVRYATTVNASTLYSGGMFDVSEEPVVVSTSALPSDRYWSVQAADQYARWFFMFGPQFTGSHAQRYLIVGPEWQGDLPPAFRSSEIIRAPSAAFTLTMRVVVKSRAPDDMQAARAMLAELGAVPLSQWQAHGDAAPPLDAQPIVPGGYRSFPRMREIVDFAKSMTATDFLQLASLAINDPAMTLEKDSAREIATLAALAEIGLRPGARFDPTMLTREQRAAVDRGFASARRNARAAMQASLVDMNGWKLQSDLFENDRGRPARAGAQDVAWGSPVPYQSHSIAYVFEDHSGRPLEGEHRYTITFDVGDLPPVTEFWELPIYDGEGYLIDNPIDRYSVTSDLLEAGAYTTRDGKLVFHLQREAPEDPDAARNWLPTPERGPFRLAARFYGPMAPLIDGRYPMPAVVRID